MIYYVFDTEPEALSAESTIVNNIKSWVQQYSPDAITEDGQKLTISTTRPCSLSPVSSNAGSSTPKQMN